ncbi:restriction endonuclease [Proteus mirabilis]|nr:restriction endonuclease [Proteus mirabilis]MBG2768069.1 restriction endonuclease [Proteus mirabilis]
MKNFIDFIIPFSALISAIIAIRALRIAKKTINENKEIAKKTVADTAYHTYLQLAMDYPKFAKGYKALYPKDPEYDQYVWYVARMLFCFEQVIEVKGYLNNTSWINTIMKHLNYHKEHLDKTKVVKERLYCQELLLLIEKSTN